MRGAVYDSAKMCRYCWLFVNDDRYAAMWTDDTPGVTAAGTRPPSISPGTELKKILAQLGAPACGACEGFARRMDVWGIEGCQARRAEIIAHLESQAVKLGWWATVKIGASAALHGLPLTAEGLLDEALRRAGATETAS